MAWVVRFHDEFEPEFDVLSKATQDGLVAAALLLKKSGPMLGRPHVDTLAGSNYPNMKELRFDADNGAWRVAFAFDPIRRAIVLVAGDKAGTAQKRFYKKLIAKADKRFADHLEALKGQ